MPDNMTVDTEKNLALEAAQQQTKEIIDRLIAVPLVYELRSRLTHSPGWARYHIGTTHSEDVLHEAILFAVYDGIDDPTDLVGIALKSLGHDIALTEDPDDPEFIPALPGHEIRSADFMRKKMREAGYEEKRITVIAESIEDTLVAPGPGGILVQRTARHGLGRYLLDADLSNLGRGDFSQKSELVYEELRALGIPLEKRTFLQGTLGLISSHQWQTNAGGILRQPQQDKNIANLKATLRVR